MAQRLRSTHTQKKKTAIVFIGNAMIASTCRNRLMEGLFGNDFFPRSSTLFMVDYPGTGTNAHVRPTMQNIHKCALDTYIKALEHSRRTKSQLWVFCISIGMGVFSSILNDLDAGTEAPYAIVSMNGLMSMRKTVIHLSRFFMFAYPFLGTIFNTAKNIAAFLDRKPDTRIAWFANEGDKMINIRNVERSVERWKQEHDSSKIYLEVLPRLFVRSTGEEIYNVHNHLLLNFYNQRLQQLERYNWQQQLTNKVVDDTQNLLQEIGSWYTVRAP